MFVAVLHCIFEDWSRIFHTRSFTLCKNDLDFNDMSYSVAVLESISSLSVTNLSVCWVNEPAPILLPTCHQISTLEKTNSCQHSTLSSSMKERPSQVSRSCLRLIPRAQRYLTFICGFPGLSDAVEASTLGSLTLHRETKFIIGFDCAVTLSSPASSCVGILISITSLPQAYWSRGWYVRRRPCNETHYVSRFRCDSLFPWIVLKPFRQCVKAHFRTEVANVKQTQKMLPFITCEIPLGQYVCELVFGVKKFDLDLGVQIDSVKRPIKSNSVGSGNMSHCRASSLYNHLDHCIVVFKDIQQSFLTRRIDVWGNKINIVQIIIHSMRLLLFSNCVRWSLSVHNGLPRSIMGLIHVSKNCDDQIPWIKCGDTIQPQSCIQGNDFWFCWTVRNWSLFLPHPTDWNKWKTSKNT